LEQSENDKKLWIFVLLYKEIVWVYSFVMRLQFFFSLVPKQIIDMKKIKKKTFLAVFINFLLLSCFMNDELTVYSCLSNDY